MSKLLIALIFGFVSFAQAKTLAIVETENYTSYFTDEQCGKLPFLKFNVTSNGKPAFNGCYYIHHDNVIMMEEKGDATIISRKHLEKPKPSNPRQVPNT